jgi:hypothetical protein
MPAEVSFVSIVLHSLDTCDLLIPESPMACTSSSTRRVDTPPIHASWITVRVKVVAAWIM